jgi:hypothetical protein
VNRELLKVRDRRQTIEQPEPHPLTIGIRRSMSFKGERALVDLAILHDLNHPLVTAMFDNDVFL